jgi:ribosomal protein S18 acetylase RimI-like enzyme
VAGTEKAFEIVCFFFSFEKPETTNLNQKMETIQSLAHLGSDQLFAAFSEAFKDYELQLSPDELEVMISRRGYVPELSFGAFENGRLVSFTLNGIGDFKGQKTAYDTGTGTIEAYRGKGLASQIFQYSVPELKKAGVLQYLLEVLQHNSSAVSVYQKQGFGVSREFNYFVESAENVHLDNCQLPAGYRILPIDLSLKEHMIACQDFAPSWQNSFGSVERRLTDFRMWGVFAEETLAGYCIFEPNSGDITQIAVAPLHRNHGLATCMLHEAAKSNKHKNLKLINTDTRCDSITRWAESIGLTLQGKQFEMVKEI